MILAAALLAAIAQGGALYATNCSSCHGARGQGSAVGPPLIGKSAADVHLMLDTGRMPAAAPGVNEIAHVPAFTPQQITALVNYVLRLSPEPLALSLPRVAPGNALRGRALFAENCAQCHGSTGDGASVGADNVAPSLAGAGAEQIAEAVRAGPGVMPPFGRDALSDRDVDDIARYVGVAHAHRYVAQNLDAGGFSLARVGPAAEGFVAWLFGLGALILFVRRIGTAGPDS